MRILLFFSSSFSSCLFSPSCSSSFVAGGAGEVGRDLCGQRKQRETGQGATGACVFCFSFELSFHSSSFPIISLFP